MTNGKTWTRETVFFRLPLARTQTFPIEQIGLFQSPLQEVDGSGEVVCCPDVHHSSSIHDVSNHLVCQFQVVFLDLLPFLICAFWNGEMKYQHKTSLKYLGKRRRYYPILSRRPLPRTWWPNWQRPHSNPAEPLGAETCRSLGKPSKILLDSSRSWSTGFLHPCFSKCRASTLYNHARRGSWRGDSELENKRFWNTEHLENNLPFPQTSIALLLISGSTSCSRMTVVAAVNSRLFGAFSPKVFSSSK